jgi:hypothetical protein
MELARDHRGHPLHYRTTERFLKEWGLKSIEESASAAELRHPAGGNTSSREFDMVATSLPWYCASRGTIAIVSRHRVGRQLALPIPKFLWTFLRSSRIVL